MNENEIELLKIIEKLRAREGLLIDRLKAIGTFSLGAGENERFYLPQKEMLRVLKDFEDKR